MRLSSRRDALAETQAGLQQGAEHTSQRCVLSAER